MPLHVSSFYSQAHVSTGSVCSLAELPIKQGNTHAQCQYLLRAPVRVMELALTRCRCFEYFIHTLSGVSGSQGGSVRQTQSAQLAVSRERVNTSQEK